MIGPLFSDLSSVCLLIVTCAITTISNYIHIRTHPTETDKMSNILVTEYSDKCIAVQGAGTKEVKDYLKRKGFSWRPFLSRGGPGWTIRSDVRSLREVQDLITKARLKLRNDSLSAEESEPKPIRKVKKAKKDKKSKKNKKVNKVKDDGLALAAMEAESNDNFERLNTTSGEIENISSVTSQVVTIDGNKYRVVCPILGMPVTLKSDDDYYNYVVTGVSKTDNVTSNVEITRVKITSDDSSHKSWELIPGRRHELLSISKVGTWDFASHIKTGFVDNDSELVWNCTKDNN